MLGCGGVYNEQALPRMFVERVDLSIPSTTGRWWVHNREATLKDLAHQAQSLLDLLQEHQKAARKEGQWTEVGRQSIKSSNGKVKPRLVTAIEDNSTPSSASNNGLPSSML